MKKIYYVPFFSCAFLAACSPANPPVDNNSTEVTYVDSTENSVAVNPRDGVDGPKTQIP
jgi:hypothetical protein